MEELSAVEAHEVCYFLSLKRVGVKLTCGWMVI